MTKDRSFKDLSLVSRLREAADEIERLIQQRDTYRNACAGKQQKIDMLMLEFCPGEMSPEQRAEWARHQVPATKAEHAEIQSAHEPKG